MATKQYRVIRRGMPLIDAAAPTDPTPPPVVSGPDPFDPSETGDYIVLSYGQSLSLGTLGLPALTTTQPFDSLNASGLVPLVESSQESHISASTNTLRNADGGAPGNGRRYIAGSRGVSGADYATLASPGTPYTNLVNLISASDTAFALIFIHGEADGQDNCDGAGCTNLYRNNLIQLRNDYDASAKGVTGQSRDVAMFLNQVSSYTRTFLTTNQVPIEQLAASETDTNIVLVCPLYHLGLGTGTIYNGDGVHLTAAGYRMFGDYIGRAMAETFVSGRPWEPLKPSSASASGSTITMAYNVPSERMGTSGGTPLALDTTAVREDFGGGGPDTMGFRLVDPNPNPRVITNVAVSGSNVILTCNDTVSSGCTVEYGLDGRNQALGGNGFATGAEFSGRGNLRDTDTTVGYQSSEQLVNWAVHSRTAVSGGATPPASVATVCEDRRWTLAYGGEDLTTAAQNWNPAVGSLVMPYVSGTYSIGNSTGANASAAEIGTNRVNNALSLVGASGGWEATAAAAMNHAADEDLLIRFVGETQRSAVAVEYLLWQGASTGDSLRVQFQSDGDIFAQFTGSVAHNGISVGALPASSQYGIVDIYIRKRPVLAITIVVNGGTPDTDTDTVAGPGFSGLDFSLCSAFNQSGQLAAREISFIGFAIGHEASWWSVDAHNADYAAIST